MSDKVAVSVKAEFDLLGQLTPLSFFWEDGVQYEVSKVLDRRRAVSLKAGGSGIRYTCRVNGRMVYLFYDESIWYFEK